MIPADTPDFEVLRANLPAIGDGLFARTLYLHDQPSAEAAAQLLASLDGARILVARMAAAIRAETAK